MLRNHPRSGKDAILSISNGHIANGYDAYLVLIGFDGRYPRTFYVSKPTKYKYSDATIFINDYAKLLSNIKISKIMRIEAVFHQDGIHVLEFNVEGLEWD